MVISMIPPTTPPTIAAVFELLPPEGEGEPPGKDEGMCWIEDKELMVENAVGSGEELEPLINPPGPISGLSDKHECEAAQKGDEEGIPTTDVLRLVGVPMILALACAVSSCSKKN